MSAAKELYDRIVGPAKAEYERQVKNLRENCPHDKLSEWIEEWWAMGHPTGYMVQSCEHCDKEIHRKTRCFICGKEILDSDIRKGDGKKLALGVSYCPKCVESASVVLVKHK